MQKNQEISSLLSRFFADLELFESNEIISLKNFLQIGDIKNDKIPGFFELIGKKKIIDTYQEAKLIIGNIQEYIELTLIGGIK